jgi:hypothetical protein
MMAHFYFFRTGCCYSHIGLCLEESFFAYISELLFVGGREGKREGEGENQPSEGGNGLQCNCQETKT